MKEIDDKLYAELLHLGIINTEDGLKNSVRNHNVGTSNYSEHLLQPWSIWLDYNLNPFDADIIKRVLRIKQGESRQTDYEKIIHICQERIRQLKVEYKQELDSINFEDID